VVTDGWKKERVRASSSLARHKSQLSPDWPVSERNTWRFLGRNPCYWSSDDCTRRTYRPRYPEVVDRFSKTCPCCSRNSIRCRLVDVRFGAARSAAGTSLDSPKTTSSGARCNVCFSPFERKPSCYCSVL